MGEFVEWGVRIVIVLLWKWNIAVPENDLTA
jgi:hypothetical protein